MGLETHNLELGNEAFKICWLDILFQPSALDSRSAAFVCCVDLSAETARHSKAISRLRAKALLSSAANLRTPVNQHVFQGELASA